jgi:hypothetical protein
MSEARWKPTSVSIPSISYSPSARSIRRANVFAVDAVNAELRDQRVVGTTSLHPLRQIDLTPGFASGGNP